MNPEHSPAPWKCEFDGNGWVIEDALGNAIACEVEKEDACLIAAAPDMLAALKSARDGAREALLIIGYDPKSIDRVYGSLDALIARAEGREL